MRDRGLLRAISKIPDYAFNRHEIDSGNSLIKIII